MNKHIENILNFLKRIFGKEEGGIVPTPTPAPTPDPDSVYLTSLQVRKALKEQLAGKLASGSKIYLPDLEYYCPSVVYTKKILSESTLDAKIWMPGYFDCEDFSYVLKADFSIDAYRNGVRRAAHCMGIVFGLLPGPHAKNWVLNDDGVVRFIEPQNDTIAPPKETDSGIWMILA